VGQSACKESLAGATWPGEGNVSFVFEPSSAREKLKGLPIDSARGRSIELFESARLTDARFSETSFQAPVVSCNSLVFEQFAEPVLERAIVIGLGLAFQTAPHILESESVELV
jgi:hypothetical protein